MSGRAERWRTSCRRIVSCCSPTAVTSASLPSACNTSRSRIRGREYVVRHGTGTWAAPSSRHQPSGTEAPSDRFADAPFAELLLDGEGLVSQTLQLTL